MTKEIKPVRVQRKRTKGYNMQSASPNGLPVKYVGRGTAYGNPYKVGEKNDLGEVVTAFDCLRYFEYYLKRKYQGDSLREFLEPLRGKNLACFCPLKDKDGNPVQCHGDVLLRFANK